MRTTRLLMLVCMSFAVLCGYAQPKTNGNAPVREKRGYDQRVVIDTANVRVLYALNATDIKDDSTYLDLGKLEVGKRVKKYSSEFVYLSDQEAMKWKKEKKWKGYVPKNFWMGGRKEYTDRWSELVYSDYIIRGNELKEYACFPLFAEHENSSYTEQYPLMKWQLANEHQTILGHKCQKATCHFRGRDFVAWFAADVPIKGGPWKFGGLPGCILKVYDTKKLYVWEAVAIEKGKFLISQYPDKLYPKSTRKSVWQRQVTYNKDYRNAVGIQRLDGRPQPKNLGFEPLEKE